MWGKQEESNRSFCVEETETRGREGSGPIEKCGWIFSFFKLKLCLARGFVFFKPRDSWSVLELKFHAGARGKLLPGKKFECNLKTK